MSASDVLDIAWEKGKYPIDPVSIAILFGMEIKYDDSLAKDGLSGKLELRDNLPPIIYVNPKNSNIRQRFIIAHELGHYFCGHDSSPRIDTEFNLSPIVYKPEERQANAFAAQLLMPEIYLNYFIFNEKIADLDILADKFKVSTMAIHFRLKNLGLV